MLSKRFASLGPCRVAVSSTASDILSLRYRPLLSLFLFLLWYSLKGKEKFVEKFRALFENGDCSKGFHGGRKGMATAGMICMFTPGGIMVGWKQLPTPASVHDVVDFLRRLKVCEL